MKKLTLVTQKKGGHKMVKNLLFPTATALFFLVTAQGAERTTYRYSGNLAEEMFGKIDRENLRLGFELGEMKAGIDADISCGKVSLDINFNAQLNNLKDQLNDFVNFWKDGSNWLRFGMAELCSLAPKSCAALRHDSFKIDNIIGQRFNACSYIDKKINSASERGRKELQANAVKKCMEKAVKGGRSTADATKECEGQTGLPLTDFQNWATKGVTRGKQKVLQAIVNFGKKNISKNYYNTYASLLGEIEVMKNGQWQPQFEQKLFYPDDYVNTQIALISSCNTLLLYTDKKSPSELKEMSLEEKVFRRIVRKNFSKKYIKRIISYRVDNQILCSLLAKSVALEGVKLVGESLKEVKTSTQIHPVLPETLKNEYSKRIDIVYAGLLSAVENNDLTIPKAKSQIQKYELLMAKNNRMNSSTIGKGISTNRSIISESEQCVDEESCSRQ